MPSIYAQSNCNGKDILIPESNILLTLCLLHLVWSSNSLNIKTHWRVFFLSISLFPHNFINFSTTSVYTAYPTNWNLSQLTSNLCNKSLQKFHCNKINKLFRRKREKNDEEKNIYDDEFIKLVDWNILGRVIFFLFHCTDI